MIEKQQIGTWTDTLASKAPVPGGGGASALGGALGAALGQMVANLTVGKKRYADVEEEMQQSLTVLAGLQAEFLHLADEDARVFAPLAQAYGMPGDTPEQKAEKEQVMEERLLAASLVPLAMMENINTKSMKNRDKAAELNRKAEKLLEDGCRKADAVYDRVRQRLAV